MGHLSVTPRQPSLNRLRCLIGARGTLWGKGGKGKEEGGEGIGRGRKRKKVGEGEGKGKEEGGREV